MRALTGFTLLDGLGNPPVPDAVLLLDGPRIAAAGPADAVSIPPDAERLALDGLYLLPGLIDAHIHLGRRDLELSRRVFLPEALWAARGAADLAKLLQAGFTTVRDCGGSIAIALRQAVQEGSIPGPRILAAGQFVERTGGADDPCFMPLPWLREGSYRGVRIADGADEVRRAVREQIRDGADWIKTCTTGAAYNNAGSRTDILEWSRLEIETLVDEAHRLGVGVAVHAHAANGIRQALQAGADTIEHGTCIDAECCRMMADQGKFLVPTFWVLHRMATAGAAFGAPTFAVAKAAALDRLHNETFQLALRHGVRIAMGTDCAGTPLAPHGDNAAELALMVAAGMTPMQALVSATSGAAAALGLAQEVGSLRPGLQADIVAVAANPARDVLALRQVRLVMQAGRIVVDQRNESMGPK